MNENTVGFITCPVCHEPRQDVRVNKNRKLYIFCDNGCAVKFNNIKSKRYLPVLLGGSDVKDETLGLIISAAKGKKENENVKQKEVRNAGFEEVRAAGRSGRIETGNSSSAGNNAGSARSGVDGRTAGNNTGNAGSIAGKFVNWLAADDDD